MNPPPPDALLLAALRSAPRRFRLPPLPADAEAAAAAGAATALAFAIEQARDAVERQAPPPAQAGALFTRALARLIEDASAPGGGDPAFQALAMQSQDGAVREHVALARQRAADLRAVRSTLDAVAHPGKLARLPAGAGRDALARLHALASAGAWERLQQALAPGPGDAPAAAAATLQALRTDPALGRLVRGDALRRLAPVQRYEALCRRHGPAAGSEAAATRGRASAQAGELAEAAGVQALRALADALNHGSDGPAASHRVVRSLRNPRGFPGASRKAKEEWDAAIVRDGGLPGTAEPVLLVETKASPAAVASDFPRLLRGLARLAQAEAGAVYAFRSDDGTVRFEGAALRALQPGGHALPPRVIYCCPAPAEPLPQALLSAASRSVLLGEPASLAFAGRLARGETPPHEALAPVWHALAHAARLRAALHQDETARTAREAMLHPDDLRALAQGLRQARR